MNAAIEHIIDRQQEMLREAVSRQLPLELTWRSDSGWTSLRSNFLGFDRSSGDLMVALPVGPGHLISDIVEGQAVGVSFRRAHRRCVFETALVGRCVCGPERGDELPALRLLWPTGILELQRRLYYRTPLPPNVFVPVQVRPWPAPADHEDETQPRRGRLMNLSAGGLSLLLKGDDNPRWQPDRKVTCSFVAAPAERLLELYGHMRYLDECPDGSVRMGVQFFGLETPGESRPALEQILDLTQCFQEMEMRRLAALC